MTKSAFDKPRTELLLACFKMESRIRLTRAVCSGQCLGNYSIVTQFMHN